MLGLWFAFIAVLLLNYLSAFFIILIGNKENSDENAGGAIVGCICIVTYIAILVLGCVLFGLNIRNLV